MEPAAEACLCTTTGFWALSLDVTVSPAGKQRNSKVKRFGRGFIAAAVTIPLVAGCSLLSPQRTSQTYTPADGWNTTLTEGVELLNFLIVTDEDTTRGTLVGRAVNKTDEAVSVLVGDQSGKRLTLKVPARDSVAIGPKEDDSLTINELPVQPGQYLPLQAALAGGGQPVQITAPVFAPDLPRYATLTPGAKSSDSSNGSSVDDSAESEDSAGSEATSTASPTASPTTTD